MFAAMKQGRNATDYIQALGEFRYQIRRFLNFSEQAARAAGLEPQQHQALLAVKGLPNGQRATVGALAERLQIQHHSAVELVDRLEAHRLVRRSRNSADRREVLVRLTGQGERLLRELSSPHRAELRSAGPALLRALRVVISQPGRGRRVRRSHNRKRPAARW
jgi:DNA-binding MarR family transcriptional regulator